MNIYKLMLIISMFFIANMANAASIEFFASNNTGEINIKTAYERLFAKPQQVLINDFINTLQTNHVEQGRLEGILGIYQMKNDKNITSDNTEIFYASPLQNFSNKQIFAIAAQLANSLNQESVAVFIPAEQSNGGEVIVTIKSQKLSIVEAVDAIKKKLPQSYANAFSLHLNQQTKYFKGAKVTEIEWLGSNINIEDIKKAFPDENIVFNQGQAYLVYKDGRAEAL